MLRKLTPEEIAYLKGQGVDISQLPDQLDVLSPDEAKQYQMDAATQQKGMISGGVVPTVKSRAGSLIGGGLAGTAGFMGAAGTAAALLGAPETGGLSLIPLAAGLLGGAGASAIGSKAGDIIQKKIVEPTIGMTPQDQATEEQQAESAQRVFPKTTMATDIIGGALASGGRPTLRAPIMATKGIVRGLAEEGLSFKALEGGSSPVYKQAIQNVITGNALNTAVNAGVQLAQTGTVDPTELGASAIGGAFFSEPSPLGSKLNPDWKPLQKMQKEIPSVSENIAPDGTSIADVEAYKKQAQQMTDEVNQQNQDFIQKRNAIIQLSEEQYQREVEQQQQQQQVAQDWQNQNWLTKDTTGNYLINDKDVKSEYIKSNKVNPKSDDRPEQQALIRSHNESLGKIPVEQMRQELYERDFPQRDPQGYQLYKQQQAEEAAANIKRIQDVRQAQMDAEAAAQQQEAARQQRMSDFGPAREEQQGQQIQEAEQQRQEQQQQGQPLTENQRRIITPESIVAGMQGGISQPREGRPLYQEAEQDQQPNRGTMSPAEHDRLLAEAGKAATIVGNVQGDLTTPEGEQARGVSYDPRQVGRRLIGIAQAYATSDTGYHELVHTMLRDLDRSPNPRHQEIAAEIRKAYGGEEPAAENIGKQYQKTVEDAATASLPQRVKQYFSDVWAATKVNMGNATPEERGQNLVRRMRQRTGEQDTTIAGQRMVPSEGSKFQPSNQEDFNRYNELTQQIRDAIQQRDFEKVYNLQQEVEAIKNRNPVSKGMPPTIEDGVGPKFQSIRFKPTQEAIERIKSDFPNDDGKRVADAFQKTLVERQNLIGQWWNKIALKAKGMDPAAVKRVDNVLYNEVNDNKNYRNTLRTQEERNLYDTIRKVYDDSYQLRKIYNEPVYRNGVPTPPQQDPFYHATTTEPSVAETFRQNKDQGRIKQLSDDFITQQMRHGIPRPQAEKNLAEQISKFQGSMQNQGGHSSEIFYGANRREQGIPLPDSWRRQDPLRNLEAFTRRSALDLAFYHNVETDPKTMANLGYTKDPWGNVVNQPTAKNITGSSAVQDIIRQLSGEHLNPIDRTAHAFETFATATILGPTTELHKTFSSLTKLTSEMSDNPIEAAKAIVAGIKGLGDAWTNVYKTGYVQMDSKKASDFLNTHLTAAERLHGLNKGIRQIYTLNNLTEHFTKSFLQAGCEYLIPAKLHAAASGDAQATRLLTKLDPDFVPGKTYTPEQRQQLASEMANLIHGSKDARTQPGWMLRDNEISAFMKLSSWQIAQTNTFMRNVVEPFRQGNYKPLIMSLFGSTIGGWMIKTLREELTGKKTNIPSLSELAASERGIKGNIPLVAYNWMAGASYAGFAGILSSVAKLPFDYSFRNIPQGATFPLDEVATQTGEILRNAVDAMVNDPNANILDISTKALYDWVKNDIQLARITINHMADAGMLKEEGYKKGLADKMATFRRYEMAQGLPYEEQSGPEGNPYFGRQEKAFKREQDIGKATQQLGPLIQNIIRIYGNNPELMMEKFKALKTNGYPSMPSMDDTPVAFFRYLRFLQNSEGPEKANAIVQDYLKHRMINEVKAGMVP